MPCQLTARVGAGRIERQHLRERARRLLVVQELFIPNAGDALEQRDLLARRDGERLFSLQYAEQLLKAALSAVDAIQAA
jgi:hypothetical protein